jgi:uncharacterized iron-regulated protein
MKRVLVVLLSVIAIFSVPITIKAHLVHEIFDLQKGEKLLMSKVISDLKKNKIILVGEHHTNENHHFAQLCVVQALNEAGVQVAIGLEMFRKDSQEALNRWVDGDIDEEEFQKIYYDNWNYSYSVYRMIFDYARQHKIPMIGLNVPRDITRQVAKGGFNSLTEEQKGKLSDVSCRVDKAYMDYIKKAFGGHGHGKLNFNYFCEAQLVWDTAFAINSIEYLKTNPNSVVVLLAGTGHVQKGAVPRQIRERSKIAHAVILPEVKGSIDPSTTTINDADYIILDL